MRVFIFYMIDNACIHMHSNSFFVAPYPPSFPSLLPILPVKWYMLRLQNHWKLLA